MAAFIEALFYLAVLLAIVAGYILLAMCFCTIGAIYGFFIAIQNYIQAFSKNVAFEKV